MITQFKTKKSLPLKIVSVILVLLMLISALPITTVSAAEKTQVNLKLGDELRYDPNINWTTHQMFVDGKMSYCINTFFKLLPDFISIFLIKIICIAYNVNYHIFRLLIITF